MSGKLPESGVRDLPAPAGGLVIVPGRCYRDGWGLESLCMGEARAGTPGLVWMLSGFHYRAADGRLAPFSIASDTPSLYDLVAEVPVPEYWAGVFDAWQARKRST